MGLLITSSNDTSVDIVDDEGSFEFSPKAEFTSPLYVLITHAADTEATSPRLHNWCSVNECIQMTFKRVIV